MITYKQESVLRDAVIEVLRSAETETEAERRIRESIRSLIGETRFLGPIFAWTENERHAQMQFDDPERGQITVEVAVLVNEKCPHCGLPVTSCGYDHEALDDG